MSMSIFENQECHVNVKRNHFLKEGKGGFGPDDTFNFKKKRWHFASGEFLM